MRRRRLSEPEPVALAAPPQTPTARGDGGEDCSCGNDEGDNQFSGECECAGVKWTLVRERTAVPGEGQDGEETSPPRALQLPAEDPATTNTRARRKATTPCSHQTNISPSSTEICTRTSTLDVLPRADVITLSPPSTSSLPAQTYDPSTHTFVPTGYQTIVPTFPPSPDDSSSDDSSAQAELYTKLGLGLGISFLVLLTIILTTILSRRHRKRRRQNQEDTPDPAAAVAEVAATTANTTPNPWAHPTGISSRPPSSSGASTTNIIITPAPGIASSPFFTSLAPAPAPVPAIPQRSNARASRASSSVLPAPPSFSPSPSPPPVFPSTTAADAPPPPSNPYASPPPLLVTAPLSSHPHASPPPAPAPRRAVSSFYPDDAGHTALNPTTNNARDTTTTAHLGGAGGGDMLSASFVIEPWDPDPDPTPLRPQGGVRDPRHLSPDVYQTAAAGRPHRYSAGLDDGVSPVSETGGGIPADGLPIRISAMSVVGPGERTGSQQWI